MSGLGIRRLQHLVLWVADVGRSERFYRDVLGFEVAHRYPQAAFMRIPGSGDDHNLGLFEQPGLREPDEHAARMYHAAWEVGDLTDLARAPAARRGRRAGRLVRSWGQPVAVREGPGRARVRDLLDGPRRHVRGDERARSRRRAGSTRLFGAVTRAGARRGPRPGTNRRRATASAGSRTSSPDAVFGCRRRSSSPRSRASATISCWRPAQLKGYAGSSAGPASSSQ